MIHTCNPNKTKTILQSFSYVFPIPAWFSLLAFSLGLSHFFNIFSVCFQLFNIFPTCFQFFRHFPTTFFPRIPHVPSIFPTFSSFFLDISWSSTVTSRHFASTRLDVQLFQLPAHDAPGGGVAVVGEADVVILPWRGEFCNQKWWFFTQKWWLLMEFHQKWWFYMEFHQKIVIFHGISPKMVIFHGISPLFEWWFSGF